MGAVKQAVPETAMPGHLKPGMPWCYSFCIITSHGGDVCRHLCADGGGGL